MGLSVGDSWDSLLRIEFGNIVECVGTADGTLDRIRVANSTWIGLVRFVRKLVGSRVGDSVIVLQAGTVGFSI